MLGVGVGFDTKGAGSIFVVGSSSSSSSSTSSCFVIPDSREGWVSSVQILLDAHFLGLPEPSFDYSEIRPAGMPIRGFGGLSSGYEPLERLHHDIRRVLLDQRGKTLTVTSIVDIMNMIGRCVVSGNVRQTAEIAFGDPSSEE